MVILFIPFAVLIKYGEMNPLSNFIPSITSSSSYNVFPSFTVITPSLPTFRLKRLILFNSVNHES